MVAILRHWDLLELMEDFMADLGHSLRIKYGLKTNPTKAQIDAWASLTRKLINSGLAKEVAGHSAAKSTFVDYRTHVYASEADTLEMLLQEAGKQ